MNVPGKQPYNEYCKIALDSKLILYTTLPVPGHRVDQIVFVFPVLYCQPSYESRKIYYRQ